MSGTSYVSSPSKGSSLSSDAPAFVPSFLRNRAIPIQRPSSTPSSTPPPSRVSTPVARKSPPPLPIGQVAQGKLSLQQPFDELNYQTLTSLKDPENELKSVSSYICQTYFRHHSDARPGKKRPVICAPVPSSAEGEARRLAYVFAMGTFEGHTDATLPLVLKRFAIPVVTLRSNADITNSPNSIRITPTWNLPEKEYCWIIAIPVGIPLSEAPTDKWHGAIKGYALEPEELKKLVAFSDQRLAEFKAMSQNNQSFEEYVKTLRTSRDERPKIAPSAPVTKVEFALPSLPKPPIESTTPSTPPEPSMPSVEIIPEVKTMCRVSKRGREEGQPEPFKILDNYSQQPLRQSKRLCVKKDAKKENPVKSSNRK